MLRVKIYKKKKKNIYLHEFHEIARSKDYFAIGIKSTRTTNPSLKDLSLNRY